LQVGLKRKIKQNSKEVLSQRLLALWRTRNWNRSQNKKESSEAKIKRNPTEKIFKGS
jgi:hypothetical protein